jgi:hypothetical protein
LATTGSGVPSFSSSRSLHQQRAPARFGEETRFGDKLAVGDLQLNLAFTEHRIRAELHQILTGNQVVDLRFTFAQVDLAAAGGRDNRVVGIDFLSSQQRLRIGFTTGCGSRSGAWTPIAFITAWRPANVLPADSGCPNADR